MLSTTLLITDIKAECVTYDVCHSTGSHEMNCPYDGPGIPLTNLPAQEILKKRCPDFFTSPGTPVCCSARQVMTMETSIQMAEGIFGRCQSCLKNMLKSICGLACDPQQDRYISVNETKYSEVYRMDYVNSLEFRIDPNYQAGVYDSCKHVTHPSSGREAMELACFESTARCDPQKWYFFMGDPVRNLLVPFKIDYVNTDDVSRRFTSETKKCSEAYDGDYGCSCVDCEESCPKADPPSPEDSGYLIFNLNATTFFIAISIGAFGIVTLMFGSVVRHKIFNLPGFFGGCDHIDRWLTRFFRWWGKSE